MMIAAVTGAYPDWAVDSLQCPGFLVGQGATLPIEPHATVRGQMVLDLCAEHEIVLLQHVPPVSFVDRLRDLGCTVLLWLDFESMLSSEPWAPPLRGLWRWMIVWRKLTGTKPNRFGGRWVDLYEAAPGGPIGKPHSFAADMTGAYAEEYVQLLARAMEPYRGKAGLAFDNAHGRPGRRYFGTASNAPDWGSAEQLAYELQWKEMLGFCRKLGIGPLWANCGAGVDVYPELDGKWDERFFNLNGYSADSALDFIMRSFRGANAEGNAHQELALHCEPNIVDWVQGREKDWQKLGECTIGLPLYVVTARSGRWYFVPPSCREM